MNNLIEFGWSDAQQRELENLALPGMPGRVIGEQRGGYEVLTAHGMIWSELPGGAAWADPLERPAVGDWVLVEPFEGLGLVRHRFERFSRLVRKAAGGRTAPQVVGANLDTVFIVSSLNSDLNPRRIERYLATVWSSGAAPVVVLTKADLCAEVSAMVASVEAVALGVPVVVVSALTDQGRQGLEPHLGQGRTVGLVGSSGVGKSTLVNWLLGQERMAVSHIRASDERGQHTTTGRHLLPMPQGMGVLMDTPGMRELGVWDAEEGIERAFADIEALADDCRFRDCAHEGEPGCAVGAALDRGDLEEGRWLSYQKLRRETAWLARRQDDLAIHLERKRRRTFSKMVRRVSRDKR